MAVRLRTPLGEEDVLNLGAGDVVHLSGTVYTARDSAHRKILELDERGELPLDLEGAVIYHCGPVVRKGCGGYEVVSAGPTTSARMNGYLDAILGLGVRGIIGKRGAWTPSPSKVAPFTSPSQEGPARSRLGA